MKFTVPHAGSSAFTGHHPGEDEEDTSQCLQGVRKLLELSGRASREDPRGSDSMYFPRTRKGRTRSHANALSVDELFGIHDICPVLGREHPDRQGIHSNHRSEDVLAPVELPRVPHLGELWRGERTPNENTLSQEARVTKGSDDRPGTVVRRVRATRTSASEHTRAQRPLSGAARVAAAVLFFRWAPPREKRSKAKSSSVFISGLE